jgi:hypothetical protein
MTRSQRWYGYLTVRQVAKLMGLPESEVGRQRALRRLSRRQLVVGTKLLYRDGRRWLVPEAALRKSFSELRGPEEGEDADHKRLSGHDRDICELRQQLDALADAVSELQGAARHENPKGGPGDDSEDSCNTAKRQEQSVQGWRVHP